MGGIFVISLDFELYWGMRDVISEDDYFENLKNSPKAIKKMLNLFEKYNIHTTWATVGFLFFKDKKDLQKNYPNIRPKYKNKEIDLYEYIDNSTKLNKISHFAPDSIKLINSYKNQEISTHTFSHYYTLEEGQTPEEFYHDLLLAKNSAKRFDIDIKSIVFPRNQYNSEYLNILKKVGITSYRGNERGWVYKAENEKEKKRVLKRVLRILDSYINLSGYHTYKLEDIKKELPINIPASRFLRPYSSKLSFLDWLKLKRIKDAMTYAAKNSEIFHLWWHPHNFGKDLKNNILFLEEILKHFNKLKKEYNFSSKTMSEVTDIL